MEQKIKTIIVTHKDRFIRFGYDWFEKFCAKFNTIIVVVNNEELSPQEELVQDIVSILHVFSCRLYVLRKYKKQIERDPASKTCHCCGAVKKDLKLSDRIFKCSCGYVEDRDFNAALNLRDAITYEVA